MTTYDYGTCPKCNSALSAGKNGKKPYCVPCYIEWKKAQEAGGAPPAQQQQTGQPAPPIRDARELAIMKGQCINIAANFVNTQSNGKWDDVKTPTEIVRRADTLFAKITSAPAAASQPPPPTAPPQQPQAPAGTVCSEQGCNMIIDPTDENQVRDGKCVAHSLPF